MIEISGKHNMDSVEGLELITLRLGYSENEQIG